MNILISLKNNIFKLKNVRITQKIKLFFSLVFLGISTTSTAGWEVKYIDDFSGTGVNWDNWNAQIDANFNNEVQCYTNDDSSLNRNFNVSNGTLKIIARKQQVNCIGLNNQSRSWTSGRINSKDKQEFLYGRIEARIRFHNLEGGTWPAFWMLENRISESPKRNDNDFSNWPNPGAGEIDVWEWFANNPGNYITNFFNTGGPNCGSEVRFDYPNGVNDVLTWHDYAIEWNEDNISFYMDDTLITSHNISACQQYKEPMFVLLNVAIGGNLGGAIDPDLSTATMEIDYLAHCTLTDQNDANRCNEDTANLSTDDDNDGISNSNDECLNTSIGASVDVNGCSIKVLNISPEVSLSITQNNSVVSDVYQTGGIVKIIANASDSNINDVLSYSWIIGGGIPSFEINNDIISFDPILMMPGTSHKINITVNDNGNPPLSASYDIEFSVFEDQTLTPTALKKIDNNSDNSGGSFNYLLLFILIMFSRKHLKIRNNF